MNHWLSGACCNNTFGPFLENNVSKYKQNSANNFVAVAVVLSVSLLTCSQKHR